MASSRVNQGRQAAARDLLAPVYGWFAEEFDTAALKAAKALLDELASTPSYSQNSAANGSFGGN